MKNLWIGILLVLPSMLLAQKIDRKVHDYGTVEQWNNPVATFVVTNNTKADIMFLPTFPAKDVLVTVPKGPIKAGESKEVTIQYFTENKGTFSRTVSLYTSNSGNTLDFTVKGDIRSFAVGALTSCPTVGPKSVEDQTYAQEFQVIDSITRAPISNAYVKLNHPDFSTINGKTDNNGLTTTKIFIGYYQVEVAATGYSSFYARGNLAPHQGRVVFELVKVVVDQPVAVLPPPSRVNPMPEPEPTPTEAPTQTAEEPWIIDPDEVVEEEPTPIPVPNPAPTPMPNPTVPPVEFLADGTLNLALYKPNNIVFVLDVSYSMRAADKLPKLKQSMKELVSVLREVDYVTIVTFSRDAQVHIPTTKANNKQYIYDMIDSLTAHSYTHGTKGIMMGYDLALSAFIPSGNNQMIVSTDGQFNSPSFSASELLGDISKHTQRGIKLSVVGFGDISEGKRLMRRMANSGSGNYIHFGQGDMQRALVDEIRQQSLVVGE